MFIFSDIGEDFLELYMHLISNLLMQWISNFSNTGNGEVCKIKWKFLPTVLLRKKKFALTNQASQKIECLRNQDSTVPKNIHILSHRGDWNFLGVEGFGKTKKFKEINV